jgi:hypothetical protein
LRGADPVGVSPRETAAMARSRETTKAVIRVRYTVDPPLIA